MSEECRHHRRALALTPVSSGLAGHIFPAMPGQKNGSLSSRWITTLEWRYSPSV